MTPYTLPPINLADPVNRQHPLNRGRLAWWLVVPGLDGGRTLADLMGLNHGTLTSFSAISGWRGTSRPGGYGRLLLSNGTSDYVTVGSSPLLEPTTITIAAWINTTSAGNTATANTILDKTRSVGSAYIFDVGGRGLSSSSGKLYFEMFNGAWIGKAGTASVNDGLWHRAVVTYDLVNIVLYIDGVQDATAAQSAAIPYVGTRVAALGQYQGNSDAFFNGSMDDVTVWGRALSAAEVRSDYELSRRGYPEVLNRFEARPTLLTAQAAAATARRMMLLGVG